MFLAAGDLPKAEASFKKAIDPDVDSTSPLTFLAVSFAAAGKDHEAASAFQTALVDGTDFPQIYQWLSEALLRTHDFGAARAILEEADGRFRALFYPVERPTTKLSAKMYRIGYVLAEWRAVERRLADIDPASPEGAELQAEVDVLRSQYQALVKRAGGGELVASGTKTKRLVAPASNPARMIGSPSACA